MFISMLTNFLNDSESKFSKSTLPDYNNNINAEYPKLSRLPQYLSTIIKDFALLRNSGFDRHILINLESLFFNILNSVY